MRFKDRADAGRRLAQALAHYKSERPMILALPRGGVPVAAEVASALDAPLDIILVRKIGAAMQPELALGAVVDGGEPIVVRNPNVIECTATNEEEFEVLCKRELEEIERRRARFVGKRTPLNPEGRVVIVIDDGIATGATMRAALQATRARKPKKLVLAVPVAPVNSLRTLRREADEVVCLTDMGRFGGVGHFYDDFRQLTDSDVIETLTRFLPSGPKGAHPARASADVLRRLAGDIEDTKAAEILSLEPSEAELEQAMVWVAGNGDIRGKERHPLDGKAARILDILTAGEDEEQRR